MAPTMAGTIIATIGIDLRALLFGGVNTVVPVAIAEVDVWEKVGIMLGLVVAVADRVEDVVGTVLLSIVLELLVSIMLGLLVSMMLELSVSILPELSVVCGIGSLRVLVDNVATVAAADAGYVGYINIVPVSLNGDPFVG